MRSLKVLVVDPNILVRQTLAQVLNEKSDVLVRVYGTYSLVERVVENEKPDIVLLSIEEVHSDGFIAFNRLRIHYPEIPIIVFTSRSTKGAISAVESLKRGGSRFYNETFKHK